MVDNVDNLEKAKVRTQDQKGRRVKIRKLLKQHFKLKQHEQCSAI